MRTTPEELADRGAAAPSGRSGKDAPTALADVYRDYARERPGRYAAARYRRGTGSVRRQPRRAPADGTARCPGPSCAATT